MGKGGGTVEVGRSTSVRLPLPARYARRSALLLALSVLSVFGVLASHAPAAVYWGDGSDIGAANLDGSARVSSIFVNESWKLPDGQAAQIHGPVCGVAVNGTHLYWSESGVVTRSPLDGGMAVQTLIGGTPGTCGVAIDASHVYWPSGGGSLGRANLDGSGADLSFVSGGQELCAVAVDGSHVYWIDRGGFSIGRARLDGSNVEHGFIDSVQPACGLAVDGGHIYWGGAHGSIGRAKLDGTEVDVDFVIGAGYVTGIAVYGPFIYWTDEGNAQGTVGRAYLDGGGANREFLVADHAGLAGVAVDSRVITLAPQPSANVRFGQIRHDRRRGIAYLTVKVPSQGALRFQSTVVHGRFVGKRKATATAGLFQLTLKLWPRRKGKVARRVHRQLRNRGRAPAMFRLIHQEAGALPTSRKKRISLILRPGRRSKDRQPGRPGRGRVSAAQRIAR